MAHQPLSEEDYQRIGGAAASTRERAITEGTAWRLPGWGNAAFVLRSEVTADPHVKAENDRRKREAFAARNAPVREAVAEFEHRNGRRGGYAISPDAERRLSSVDRQARSQAIANGRTWRPSASTYPDWLGKLIEVR